MIRIVSLPVLFLLAIPAGAQLTGCNPIATTKGFKVVLDDITLGGGNSTEGQTLMNRLQFKLETTLEQLAVETDAPLTVLRCAGRRPRGAGDFAPAIVSRLNANDVLVELWGSVYPRTPILMEALVSFALVPVREYAPAQVAGVYTITYPKQPGRSPDLVELLAREHEFNAFLSVSLGVKLMKSGRHAEALRFLCRGHLSLQEAAKHNPGATPLLQYVVGLVEENRKQAPELAALRRLSPLSGGRNAVCP